MLLVLLVCYVNLSKNSFFWCSSGGVPDLRVQRYDYFWNHQNFLKKKFNYLALFFEVLISINPKSNYTF
jgi:hypothetical protein